MKYGQAWTLERLEGDRITVVSRRFGSCGHKHRSVRAANECRRSILAGQPPGTDRVTIALLEEGGTPDWLLEAAFLEGGPS